MTRKHYNLQECEARRWFSKAEWRRRGLKIHDDAKPIGTLWIKGRTGVIDVYAEDQGTRINFSAREIEMRAALEKIAHGTWKGAALTDETALALQRQAKATLGRVY